MGGLTWNYVLKRIGMWFLTVWLGTTIIFLIPRLAPGDPVAAMISRMTAQSGYIENSAQLINAWRARFGLDDPLPIQYLRYVGNSLRFDLGLLAGKLSQSRRRHGLSGVALDRGPPFGGDADLVCRRQHHRRAHGLGAHSGLAQGICCPVSLTFTSIPFFMLGILLIYVFAFGLQWLPASGSVGRGLTQGFNWPYISSIGYHAILPAMAIVIASMGFWALGMRGMMITTAGEDYMILAQAKGLRPSRIFWLYGVRNSILPQVTALALALGGIVGGAVLVEYIFAYPGVGYLLYQGIVTSDYTLIQGIVFMLVFTTATLVLILDLTYPLIDPRITYERG